VLRASPHQTLRISLSDGTIDLFNKKIEYIFIYIIIYYLYYLQVVLRAVDTLVRGGQEHNVLRQGFRKVGLVYADGV